MAEERNKYSLGACVVIYNPGPDVIENINTYADISDKIVVVDNSTAKTEVNSKLAAMDKVVYIDMNGNSGIAAALNSGLEYLYKNGIEYALTMDQDSRFPSDKAREIVYLFEKYIEDYAILSLGYKPMRWIEKYDGDIADVDFWITSGNFLKLQDFKDVNGFNSALFIDYVDHEFCRRLKKAGKKTGVICRYYLDHAIGSPRGSFRFLGTRYSFSSNHTPVRYYYRYRNIVFLHREDRKFFSVIYRREIFVNIIRMLVFDNDRLKKLRMIIRGVKDGRKGKLGSFTE